MTTQRRTGPELDQLYGRNGARTARYRETGDWYGACEKFPINLYDGPYHGPHGRVTYKTPADLRNCPVMTVNPGGQITARQKGSSIRNVPGYARLERKK
jgi:hypothetical protein